MFHKDVRGMTLLEVIVSSAVLAIVMIPVVSFLSQSVKGLLVLDNRRKAGDAVLKPAVEIERSLKEVNEVIFCSSSVLLGYMDSYMNPQFAPTPTLTNIDEDNDGLTATRTMFNYLNNAVVANRPGWQIGLDLHDDDDNNNQKRDVICRFQYVPAARQVVRDFMFDQSGAWYPIPATVIASEVVDFSFTPSGGGATEPDPNTHAPPPIVDANGNGMLDLSELDTDGDVVLSTGTSFNETRYIKQISYSITIQPDPKRPEKNTYSNAVRLPLAAVKEKFQ